MSSGPALAYSTKTSKYRRLVEDAGFVYFELGISPSTTAVFGDQSIVRECAMRVLVKSLQIRRGRRGIEVIVKFLYVLAVIPLGARSGRTGAPSGSDPGHSTGRSKNRRGTRDR